MARKYRVSVGKLPTGVESVRLFYRKFGRVSWAKLIESKVPTFTATIPVDGNVDVQAYAIDENGNQSSQFRLARAKAADTVQDRAAVSAVIATPTAKQDGPNITVAKFVNSNEKADEYDVEVRTSDTSTAAKDAVTHGVHEANGEVTVMLPPDESAIDVHTRVTRKRDQTSSPWTTTTAAVVDPPVAGVADHSTDFAGGTLETADGQAVLEISSGDLRQKSIVIDGATTGTIDDYTTMLICDAGQYWSPATYTTANLVLPAEQDIQLQLHPKLTSITRETRVIDDWDTDPICYPTEQENGTPIDTRILQRSSEGLVDATPVEITWSVATSTSATPTFTDNDFVEYVPATQLPNVRTYAVRAAIKTWFNRLVTIDQIQVRRWIFCKARPWCSHAETGELIWYHETAGSENDLVMTLTGAEFERVTIEVDWVGQGVTDDELIVEINSNASNPVIITPGTYDVETARERVRMHFIPATGQYRRFVIDDQYKYAAAGATDTVEATPRVMEWADSATVITALRFTTNGAGFGADSRFRAWGHRKINGVL